MFKTLYFATVLSVFIFLGYTECFGVKRILGKESAVFRYIQAPFGKRDLRENINESVTANDVHEDSPNPECICEGENEVCSFIDGMPSCGCLKGYIKNGEKCEHCDCNENQECFLDEGKVGCRCKENFAELYDNACEECICEGENEVCSFIDDKPSCGCLKGYIKNGEKCEPATSPTTTRTGDVTKTSTGDVTTKSTGGVTTTSTGGVTTKRTGDVTTKSTDGVTIKSTAGVTATSTGGVKTTSTDGVTTTSISGLTTTSTGRATTTSTGGITTTSIGSDTTTMVSCDPNPCVKGNCTLIGENEYECRCYDSDGTTICRDLNTAGADSNLVSIIAGSVTGSAIIILALIFSGIKIRRRRKMYNNDYLEDTDSSQSGSACDFRIPSPREIPTII